MSSKVLFALYVCPSVGGWYAIDIYRSVPNNDMKDFQKCEVNLGSLSNTIEVGISNHLKRWSMKS
jgi:hypothetical protein